MDLDRKTHQISDDEENTGMAQPSLSSGCTLKPSSDENQTQEVFTSSSSTSLSMQFKLSAENAKEIFPRRLLRILSDKSISDIITWLPHGNAFVVLKTDKLADTVLPKYFPESCVSAQQLKAKTSNGSSSVGSTSSSNKSQTCKYPSFTRKLNRWGFRQVTRGLDSGAFHHKFFNREKPDNCLKMVCQRSKRRKGDKSSISLRNSTLRPASGMAASSSSSTPSSSQFLGPYSAALRQQPTVEDGSSNSVSNLAINTNLQPGRRNIHQLQGLSSSQNSNMECESDSSVSMNTLSNRNVNINMNMNNQTQNHILALNTMMNNVANNNANNQLSGAFKQATQNYEDQATIISSPSCNTPPPNNNNNNNSLNASPMSQIIRTVSTNSSSFTQAGTTPSVNLNSNFSFPVFTNNGVQLDPRLLITHNLATTGNMFGAAVAAAAAANSSSSSTTTTTSTTNNANLNNSHNLNNVNGNAQSISQSTPVMPNFITVLESKNVQNGQCNNNSSSGISSNQQIQLQSDAQNQHQQQIQAQPSQHQQQTQIQNMPKFHHAPILPAGGACTTTAPSSIPLTTATNLLLPTAININSSNSTVISNMSSNSSLNKTTTQQHQQQQLQNNNSLQQQQQSEAELRFANAKTMLYNAYLKALG